MPSYDTLLADAAQLPVAERIHLIDAIWDTLPEDALPPLSDEWLTEICRRSSEYDSGSTETIPWEQVKSQAMHRIGRTPDASH